MNPIQEWLGLDVDKPNHYQLLGLADFEKDIRKIEAAADRAMARVRSCRPGPHATLWAHLLDQLDDAKRRLIDPQQRAEYDCCLRDGKVPFEPFPEEPPSPRPAAGNLDKYPPGAEPPTTVTIAQTDVNGTAAPRAVDSVDEQPSHTATKHERPTVPHLQPNDDVEPPLPVFEPLAPGDLGPPVNPFVPTPSDTMAGGFETDWQGPYDDPQVPLAMPASVPSSSDFIADKQPVPVVPGTLSAPPVSNPTGTSGPTRHDPSSSATASNGERARSEILLPVFVGVTAGLLVLLAFGVSQTMRRPQDPPRAGATTKIQTGSPNPPSAVGSAVGNTNQTPDAEANPKNTAAAASQPSERTLGSGLGRPARRRVAGVRQPETGLQTNARRARENLDNVLTEEVARDPRPATVNRADLLALGEALTAARRAMTAREFAAAASQFETARSVAKSVEHKAMVRRLQRLYAYVMEFYTIVEQTLASLDAGSEIKISETTVVSVVEIEGNTLTLFVAGRHRSYPLDNLSPGLAMALVTQSVGQDNPRLPLLKGAYLAVHERTTADELDTVRAWWNAASLSNPVANELLATLDDDYQLTKRD